MKTVLITGGFGQLGCVLSNLLSDKFNLIRTSYSIKNMSHIANCQEFVLDVTDANSYKIALSRYNPDIIINCAALTNVDFCEENRDQAHLVNVEGVRNLVKFSNKKTKIIHISTDYVFDGDSNGDYLETSPTFPINYYGKTKLEAENLLRGSNLDYAIIRSSMLYGAPLSSKSNFFSWVYDSLVKGYEINAIDDCYSNPAWMNQLSEIILKIIILNNKGIFHFGSSDKVSRYDFANIIADVFDLDSQLINKVSSEELNFTARRPNNTSLSNSKLNSEIGIKPYSVEFCLCRIKESSIFV